MKNPWGIWGWGPVGGLVDALNRLYHRSIGIPALSKHVIYVFRKGEKLS